MPNNPALAELTWLQKNWILANIMEELNQSQGAMPQGTKAMGLDDEEFKKFSQEMRLKAEQQRREMKNGN